MCGIVGYTVAGRKRIDEATLVEMREALFHRGPDDAGLYVSDDGMVGLAHRRLAIIDLSSNALQPMQNEDGSVWIVFNGEIYNFPELKEDLVDKGHIFRSNSDTEVIIHAYEEYGTSCVDLLCGMFAFGIYDENEQLIFLGRDRFGIKPLYYCLFEDRTFAFASELKSLLKLPGFDPEIHYGALGDYFKYRYIPAPRTIWKNVHKLQHGHCAIYDVSAGSLTNWQYYSLSKSVAKRKSSDLEEVEHNFRRSVKRHLISDVEVGTLLSGGIDSSAVTAIACVFHPQIRSFSIGFKPDRFSELPYSQSVAQHLKIDHIFQVMGDLDEGLMDLLPTYYDEPLADSSCLPTFILCGMVSAHVKVVLSGDGGDELFGGYSWYKSYLSDLSNNVFRKIFPLGRVFFKKNVSPTIDFENYYSKLLLDRFDREKLKELFSPEVFDAYSECDERLYERYADNPFKSVRYLQYIDMNTFMVDDILTKVDRASMAHSLEVRVPLLDHELVESVCCLDEKTFPTDSTDKRVLKLLVEDMLPGEILTRKKMGFSAPVASWETFGKVGEFLLEGRTVADGLFQKDFVQKLTAGKYPNSPGMLWMMYVFEKWYRKWI
jgi:asparagine synthase (glutamine-hydrolysing)